MRRYAGIGSRQTPQIVLKFMSRTAQHLANQGFTLCSGGAEGADKAFEHGANLVHGQVRIWRPEHATEASLELAAKHHPAWFRCSEYAKKLHARNCLIVLGPALNDPVDFIMCWTPEGKVTGGTGQALRLANTFDIPIINLGV